MLAAEGIEAAVASLPCFELFQAQPRAYRKAVLNAAPRIAIEAAVRDSWDRFLREDDAFIGMTGFGASAPAEALYAPFRHHRGSRRGRGRARLVAQAKET